MGILPDTVGLAENDEIAVAAFDFDQLPTATYKLVQPTWMNLFQDGVIPHTYEYVFYNFKDKFSDFNKFKESCVPDQSVFLALKQNGPSQGEPGFEAYKRIVEGEYGAQMREVGCTEDQEGYGPWSGSCRCQSNSECNAVVQKFCGTNSSVCDPSPYLCPSDGTLPVGSVGQVLERDPTAKSMEQMASPSISFLPTSSKPRKVCKSQNKYSVLRKRLALVISV